jgi:large subunit ribosomal protein L23
VAEIFDVRVTRVNTINRRGKVKRTGWKMGKRPDSKRALVTLAVGSSIDIFEV